MKSRIAILNAYIFSLFLLLFFLYAPFYAYGPDITNYYRFYNAQVLGNLGITVFNFLLHPFLLFGFLDLQKISFVMLFVFSLKVIGNSKYPILAVCVVVFFVFFSVEGNSLFFNILRQTFSVLIVVLSIKIIEGEIRFYKFTPLLFILSFLVHISSVCLVLYILILSKKINLKFFFRLFSIRFLFVIFLFAIIVFFLKDYLLGRVDQLFKRDNDGDFISSILSMFIFVFYLFCVKVSTEFSFKRILALFLFFVPFFIFGEFGQRIYYMLNFLSVILILVFAKQRIYCFCIFLPSILGALYLYSKDKFFWGVGESLLMDGL